MDTPTPTSKLPTILLVISALGLFTTTLLLAFQNTSLQSQISILESKITTKPISTPTPTLSPTTTITWNTYKDDKYKYSVDYPPKWFLNSEVKLNQHNTYFVNTVDDLNPSMGGLDQTQVLVVVSSTALDYPKISKTQDFGTKKYTNITGRLYSWESVSEGNKLNVNRKGFDFVAKSGSYNILFRIFSTPEKTKSDQLVFEQMLNSFRFSNQKENFCGGIAGIVCPDGFTCKLDGNYPDAGGVCEAIR